MCGHASNFYHIFECASILYFIGLITGKKRGLDPTFHFISGVFPISILKNRKRFSFSARFCVYKCQLYSII